MPEETKPQDVTETQLAALVSKSLEASFGPRLKTLEESIAKLGAPAGESRAGQMVGRDAAIIRSQEDQLSPEQRKGLLAGQFLRTVVVSRLERSSQLEVAQRIYGEGHPVVKAVAKALSSDVFGSGGALVPTEVSAEVIELLRPASAVRMLNPVMVPMDSGKLQIPKITGGATASYTAEAANGTVTSPTTGDLNLSAKKLVALVVLSNDLIRRASVQTDMLFRDDMVASIAQVSDYAFIRGAGDVGKPKGLRYWAPSGSVTATAGTTLANVTSDLSALVLALRTNNVRMLRPGWLMAPRSAEYVAWLRDGNGNLAFPEMAQGRLRSYPVGISNQIPTNLSTNQSELYFADFADVVIGETTQIILDASPEAAYYDGSAVQAAFSRDQTVLRAIVEHDLGMRHDASVAVKTGITYGA